MECVAISICSKTYKEQIPKILSQIKHRNRSTYRFYLKEKPKLLLISSTTTILTKNYKQDYIILYNKKIKTKNIKDHHARASKQAQLCSDALCRIWLVASSPSDCISHRTIYTGHKHFDDVDDYVDYSYDLCFSPSLSPSV